LNLFPHFIFPKLTVVILIMMIVVVFLSMFARHVLSKGLLYVFPLCHYLVDLLVDVLSKRGLEHYRRGHVHFYSAIRTDSNMLNGH